MATGYFFSHRHILGIDELSKDDILHILDTADSFKEISARPIKKVPTLRGHTVINLFYEPSTRTRLSFEIAAKRMSADTFNISPSTSSATKGETLIDTARNISAMHPDIIIVRHSFSGAPHMLSRYVNAAVINAGDGAHEHPSQGLLDMMTVKEHKGRLNDLKIAIIGDISHSRVAHSAIEGFTTMGSEVHVFGPATLLPKGLEQLGAKVCTSMEEVVRDADVVMTLRIQLERQNDPLLPSLREYSRRFGVSQKMMSLAKPDALVMHPGPVNRGVELMPEVADSTQSVILNQVTNGVAVRMALLYLVMGNS
ncbi:aspartate carbamoyltransferase catalytic subunit [Desulfogranum marinum]|uniref:aspartate carbamoyltransferase catalytic subunit n=1 Tax=Desulfogranum marinum TaxID=453220 RepID=UPI0019669373|nr:aspartate carbamoyltransferase catalytic subunit [Desulfogranum marinum]MBM9513594.1 aspartate carbamoyltransferase catalytic subunit [Desulfogranum marinum]